MIIIIFYKSKKKKQIARHRVRSKSQCSVSTMSDCSVEKEEEQFLAGKEKCPPSRLIRIMYGGVEDGNMTMKEMLQCIRRGKRSPRIKSPVEVLSPTAAEHVRSGTLSITPLPLPDNEINQSLKTAIGGLLGRGLKGKVSKVMAVMKTKRKESWSVPMARNRSFVKAKGPKYTIIPLAKREEEHVWYKHGVPQKPELRRSERRALNIGGTNMTSTKTYKVTELLNYDNSEVSIRSDGKELTIHCPQVEDVMYEDKIATSHSKTKKVKIEPPPRRSVIALSEAPPPRTEKKKDKPTAAEVVDRQRKKALGVHKTGNSMPPLAAGRNRVQFDKDKESRSRQSIAETDKTIKQKQVPQVTSSPSETDVSNEGSVFIFPSVSTPVEQPLVPKLPPRSKRLSSAYGI